MGDKLELWNSVSKTDPKYTKKVTQRGGFTAIAAHSQVMRATEVFGPVGIGWGYENGEPIFHDALVFVPVTIWHGDKASAFGPIYGGAEWKSPKGHLDSDAIKKASTDGLTKALSHLGFNADVFMGLFDDNKYVEAVAKEFEPTIDEAQIATLITGLEHSGSDTGKFLGHFKIANISELPAREYERAYALIQKKMTEKGNAA